MMRFHHSTAFTLHEHRFLFEDAPDKPETKAEDKEKEKKPVDTKEDAEKGAKERAEKAQEKIKQIENQINDLNTKIKEEEGKSGPGSPQQLVLIEQRDALQSQLDALKKPAEEEKVPTAEEQMKTAKEILSVIQAAMNAGGAAAATAAVPENWKKLLPDVEVQKFFQEEIKKMEATAGAPIDEEKKADKIPDSTKKAPPTTPEEIEERVAELKEQIQKNSKELTENKALSKEDRDRLSEEQSELRDQLEELKPPKTVGDGITRDLYRSIDELREAGNDWMKWLVIIGKMLATIMDAYHNLKNLGQPYKKPDEKKDTNNAPKTAQERVDEKLKKNKEEGVPKPKDDAENKEQVKKQNEKDRETLKGEKKTLKTNIKDAGDNDKKMFDAKQDLEKQIRDIGDDKEKAAQKGTLNDELIDLTKRMEKNQTNKKKYEEDLKVLEKKEADLEEEYKLLGGEIKKDEEKPEEKKDEEKPEEKKDEEKKEEKKPVNKKDELKKEIGLTTVNEWVDSPRPAEQGVKYLQTETGRLFRSFANMVDEIKNDGKAVEAAGANGFPEGKDAETFRTFLAAGALKDWVKAVSGHEFTMHDDGTNIVLRARKSTKDASGKIIKQDFYRYVPGKRWSTDSL